MDPTVFRPCARPLAVTKLSQSAATHTLADSPDLPGALSQPVTGWIEPQLRVTGGVRSGGPEPPPSLRLAAALPPQGTVLA